MKIWINKRFKKRIESVWLGWLMGVLFFSLPLLVWAETKAPVTDQAAVPKEDQKIALEKKAAAAKKKKKKRNGWYPKLGFGVNILLNQSANVPGIDDGFTFSLGIVANGELLMLHNKHEWKTTLKGVYTQTKTPSIDPFVKTADNLDVQSFYTYRIGGKSNIGLFGGLQLNVALFPGNLVTATDTTVVRIDGEKRTKELVLKNVSFGLTPAFSPLILKQKLGVEAKPVDDKFAALRLRFNAASQEVFASGYTLQDDAATPELELVKLRDYVQLGAELQIKVEGNINKRISYNFMVGLMYPIVTSIPTDLEGFDLMNADMSLKVSLKFAKWASLDYVFSAKLVPLLSRTWQVTNNLVLSIKADFL